MQLSPFPECALFPTVWKAQVTPNLTFLNRIQATFRCGPAPNMEDSGDEASQWRDGEVLHLICI